MIATYAILFFVLMSIVMLVFARRTINHLPARSRAIFKWACYANAAALIGSIELLLTGSGGVCTSLPRLRFARPKARL
jgi:hypothetical protein